MPSKKVTRRSVSLKGLTFQRMQKYCYEAGVPVSGYLEELIRADLEHKGRPQETVLEPRTTKIARTPAPQWGSGVVHF